MVAAGETIGHYRLLQRIGAGGMGEVFLAADTRVDRRVAVKVLTQAGGRPDLLARFHNEARLHARLFHGHIARLFGFVVDADPPYLVMEYLGGPTLGEWLQTAARVAPGERLRLFAGVAEAVAYLHGNGVIHRDIKPANIRLGGDGRAKLLDFGIARDRDTPALTKAGNVVGTIHYLAPELLRGDAATPASDVWALGVVLYEMLTGRTPFTGDSAATLIRAVEAGRFPSPAALVPGLPPPLAALVLAALAPLPAARPADGGRIADGVHRCLQALADAAPSPAAAPVAVLAAAAPAAAPDQGPASVLARLRRLGRRGGR